MSSRYLQQVSLLSGPGQDPAPADVLLQDGAIAAKPASLSFEEAAALCFGGTTALHFLRDRARVARGERVLVNGAGGSVGIAAVQIARHLGAHVTAVCSLGKANRVASLGAQATIDYGTIDFAVLGERWDVIVDTVGNVTPPRVRSAMNARGRLLLLVAGLPDLIAAPFHSARGRLAVIAGVAPRRREDVLTLKALFDAGAYKPVIDSRGQRSASAAPRRALAACRRCSAASTTPRSRGLASPSRKYANISPATTCALSTGT